MRYFYYGPDDGELSAESKYGRGVHERKKQELERIPYRKGRYGRHSEEVTASEELDDGLVIEEDTIYEIDRECMKCLENKSRFNKW